MGYSVGILNGENEGLNVGLLVVGNRVGETVGAGEVTGKSIDVLTILFCHEGSDERVRYARTFMSPPSSCGRI